MVTEINSENIQSFVVSKGVTVLDCYATWCGPCKVLGETIEKLSEKHGEAFFYKCDVEQNEDFVSTLNIRNLPTLIFYKDGKEVDRLFGSVPAERIRDVLIKLM